MMTSFCVADIDEVEIAVLALAVGRVGDELAIATRPTRTAPTGPANGMSETISAALAPLMKRMSGSFSPSALSRTRDDLRVVEIALRERAGAAGDPSCAQVRISFSVGRPSRLK